MICFGIWYNDRMKIYSIIEESKFKTKKRTQILNEAYKLFVETSIEEVNMLDIASACDMERRSLYNYYNNKEQIAMDIMKCWFAEIERISAHAQKEYPNAFEEIKALVYAFYDFAVEDQDAVKFSVHFDHFFKSRYGDTDFEEFSSQMRVHILHEDLLLAGIADCSIKPEYKDIVHEASLAIQGAMLAYAQRIIFRESGSDPALVKLLLDILLDSLKA